MSEMIDPKDSDLRVIGSGLDALETTNRERESLVRRVLRSFSPLLAVAFFIFIWQIAIMLTEVESYILPSPSEVFEALKNQWQLGNLQDAVLRSVWRGAQGFALAVLIATPLGLLLGLNRTLRSIFGPILLGLQQLPSVAWVPAAIIWFGLSSATIFAVVLLGAIPSIANGLITGIDQIPKIYLRVSRVLGATRWQHIRSIVLPASWTGYLAGLEQGWAFAWRSLMAAELIAISPALGLGVGQLLDVGRQLGDMSLIVGTILVILMIGVLIEKSFFSPLRTRTLRNRGLL